MWCVIVRGIRMIPIPEQSVYVTVLFFLISVHDMTEGSVVLLCLFSYSWIN